MVISAQMACTSNVTNRDERESQRKMKFVGKVRGHYVPWREQREVKEGPVQEWVKDQHF